MRFVKANDHPKLCLLNGLKIATQNFSFSILNPENPDKGGFVTQFSFPADSLELECETERESPFTKFLFREFLQAVVFLAVHIYTGHIAR